MAAALKLPPVSLHAATPSRVRSQNSPASAALDCDRRSGSEGDYAVADATASLINHWLRKHEIPEASLFGNQRQIPFSLFLRVSGGTRDPRLARIPFPFSETAITDYKDLSSPRAELERLPGCATDASRTVQSDSLNAVGIGQLTDIGAAWCGATIGVTRASPTSRSGSSGGNRTSSRGRGQAGAPATWIRGWLAPIRFQGQLVYLAQVGRPIAGRFAPRGETHLTLHENVDEARDFLVHHQMYSSGLDKLGFVNGVGVASSSRPRTTLDGATYYTDGLRAVEFFATRPGSLSDVDFSTACPIYERDTRQPGATGDALQ